MINKNNNIPRMIERDRMCVKVHCHSSSVTSCMFTSHTNDPISSTPKPNITLPSPLRHIQMIITDYSNGVILLVFCVCYYSLFKL